MRKTILAASVAALMLFSGALSAATYRLFVHGRSTDNHCTSNYSTDHKNYWGSSVSGLSNVRYVGWDGVDQDAYSWSNCGAQRQLYNAMQSYCKGGNQCEIYSHSTGGLIVAYFLRYYGSGYNITRVQNMASAAGGSELADFSSSYLGWLGVFGWDVALAVDNSVSTSGARNWDHNSSNGYTIYTTSGEGSDYFNATSGLLPGKDDGVVANHSLCSINAVKDVDVSCATGNGRLTEKYTCWKSWNPFATCKRYYYRWTPYYTVYRGGSGHSHSDAKSDYNRR